mgnify:CR=1 FL=1
MQDKISDYGFGFQAKLVSCMMTDKTFVGQIYDLLKLDYFDSQSVSFLVEKALKYFKEYRSLPTLEVFKVHIERVSDPIEKKEIVSTLKAAVQYADADDIEFVKTTIIEFCKNQEIKNVIIESVDLLQYGKYDKIKSLMDDALKIGTNLDIGLDYTEDIESRFNEESRNPVPTGWEPIDELMKGGLAPGELGFVIGGSGAGKCVGGDTKIKIQYEEIGINLLEITGRDITIWLSPWYEIEHEGSILKVHDIMNLMTLTKLVKNSKLDITN